MKHRAPPRTSASRAPVSPSPRAEYRVLWGLPFSERPRQSRRAARDSQRACADVPALTEEDMRLATRGFLALAVLLWLISAPPCSRVAAASATHPASPGHGHKGHRYHHHHGARRLALTPTA